MTHYECLRVAPDATVDELRAAYRSAAREAHPDRHGERSAERMAAVNEAWRILGDPDRRRRYDAQLQDVQRPMGSAADRSNGVRTRPDPVVRVHPGVNEPARFPWRFMAVMATFGIGFVLLGVILAEEPQPAVPDNILRSGDCVTLSEALEAAEVSCVGPYDATVRVLVPFDETCPTGTEPYRDRQGMGNACIVRTAP